MGSKRTRRWKAKSKTEDCFHRDCPYLLLFAIVCRCPNHNCRSSRLLRFLILNRNKIQADLQIHWPHEILPHLKPLAAVEPL